MCSTSSSTRTPCVSRSGTDGKWLTLEFEVAFIATNNPRHFPELAKILNDNLAYSRVVLKMGFRSNAREADLADVLPEEIEQAVKAAAEISMGTEITDEDLEATSALAEQVVRALKYELRVRHTLTS